MAGVGCKQIGQKNRNLCLVREEKDQFCGHGSLFGLLGI